MSEEVFSSTPKGNLPSDLIAKLELEVPKLYDFLVRMTGSVNRADETTQEVLDLMRKVKKDVPYEEVRVALYSLARKLNKSYWNRTTARLANKGFQGAQEDKLALKLESLLGKLEGPEREKILLRHRLGFEDSQILKIMQLPNSTSIDLADSLSELGVIDTAAIKNIPNHPIPEATLYQTRALSVVMEDFDNKKKALGSFKVAVWVGIALLAAGAIYYHLKK